MSCGSFNNQQAQKFPKIIQHSSPRCDVLHPWRHSSRVGRRMQVVLGSWAEILKGVCNRENERRTSDSYKGELPSPAGLYQDTPRLLVPFSKSDLIRCLLDGGCRMGRWAS